MSAIVGTIPMTHNVDSTGSFTLNVPLQLPQCRFMPTMALAYHSASTKVSPLGVGWSLMGASIIERVPATLAQDGKRGVVGYNEDDRFAIDGQRLIKHGTKGEKTEYRTEVEGWSRIFAFGPDAANPTFWEQYLADGTVRTFGITEDSNVKGLGTHYTRVWAVSDVEDPFSNYITFAYINATDTGAYYLENVKYGGNRLLKMVHQRNVSFNYELRKDVAVEYFGGFKISTMYRLKEIRYFFSGAIKGIYEIGFDYAPLTESSRVVSITLIDKADEARVSPLKFDWVNGQPKVFDAVKDLAKLPISTLDIIQAIPLDVNAEGESDVVITSTRQNPANSNKEELYIDVFLADSKGGLSDKPTAGSGFTGLLSPTNIFALDANADGRTDLLHISKNTLDYSITLLLSNGDGFKAQESVSFKPEVMGGQFHTGDFVGNGRIGLVYFYVTSLGSDKELKFVQFTSDGEKMEPFDAQEGPLEKKGVGLKNFKVVVGDLNGNGLDDVFVLTPRTDTNPPCWMIYLFQTVEGKLKYRASDPLADAGTMVPLVVDATVLPFRTDSDGKTGLLFLTQNLGNLEYQLLRSTGFLLVADKEPTTTTVPFYGNVSLARISSQTTSDIVSVGVGTAVPKISILKFSGETFKVLTGVTQPADVPVGTLIRWADIRGRGVSDCLLNAIDPKGSMTVRILQAAGGQPPDRIIRASNGVGASTTLRYAPLTDASVYSDDGPTGQQPKALMNSLANNYASANRPAAGSSTAQNIEYTRSGLVYYPSYVVQSLSTNSGIQSSLDETFIYTYFNARIAFDGRGWLGFQTITKKASTVGVVERSTYNQSFPLVGQVIEVLRQDSQTHSSLQLNKYQWESKRNKDQSYTVFLQGVSETYYEDGLDPYDVYATFTHDGYGNITQTSIASTQPGALPLTIDSTFDDPNPEGPWVVGNKRTEVVKHNNQTLRQMKKSYIIGTSVCNEMGNEIKDGIWATSTYTFDQAGNVTETAGPFGYQQNLTYDATYSTITSTTVKTSTATFLVEKSIYDLTTSLPLEIETPNGVITQIAYDILGRKKQVSQGIDRSNLDILETTTFSAASTKGTYVETRNISNGLSGSEKAFRKELVYYDGLQRPVSSQKSRPDNLNSLICIDTKYDPLGRIVARSREYLSGSDPSFFISTYDKRSRLTNETYPASKVGGPIVTHSFKYSCASGIPKVIETLSNGTKEQDQTIIREMAIVPNADNPSFDNFVKLCVRKRTNEIDQTVNTTYDGLARATKIIDPSGVQLELQYDRLSRQIERKITTAGEKPATFSHFTVEFIDNEHRTILTNVLNGATVKTRTDFIQRVLLKTTKEGTVTYQYDYDKLSQGRLYSVTSPTNTRHQFGYDKFGNHTSTIIDTGDRTFETTYTWNGIGQLQKIKNPDGNLITQTYFPDGLTPKKFDLSTSSMVSKASLEMSQVDNAFALPLTHTFGNGVVSKSTILDNGIVIGNTLANPNKMLLDQKWTPDAFNKIQSHEITDSSKVSYQYDLAGQLVESVQGGSADPIEYDYDDSGNIKTKGDYTLFNDGWQLKSMKNTSGRSVTFEYSTDGNLIKKESASSTATMTYDSEGRLLTYDGKTFEYDFAGKLFKVTSANGDIVIYPSPSYEVAIARATPTKETRTSYLSDGRGRCASYETEVTVNAKGLVEDSVSEKSPLVYYFHKDHLGSTIAVSDEKGGIVTRYQYDALGKVTFKPSEPDVARYKYCGKELFGSGLYYFGARFYDSEIGRFLTLDNYPIDIDNISPSSFNLYLFSRNDFINFIDVNGNDPVPWWHWVADFLLIIGGFALTAAAVINPWFAIAGGALIGAGVSGLITDIAAAHENNNDNGQWFLQLGLGAAFGAFSAGGSAVINSGIRHGTKALFTQGFRQGFKRGVVKTPWSVLLDTGIGAGAGAAQQAVTNIINGEPIGKGVGDAAFLGAVGGFLFSGGVFALQARTATVAARAEQGSSRLMALYSVRSGQVNPRVTLARGRSTANITFNDSPYEPSIQAYFTSRGYRFSFIDDL